MKDFNGSFNEHRYEYDPWYQHQVTMAKLQEDLNNSSSSPGWWPEDGNQGAQYPAPAYVPPKVRNQRSDDEVVPVWINIIVWAIVGAISFVFFLVGTTLP